MFHILPDPQQLERSMRHQLSRSLESIFTQISPHISIDTRHRIKSIDNICLNRIEPGIYSRYYDLVLSLESGDLVRAEQIIKEISQITDQPSEFAIIPYQKKILGEDYERFPKFLFSEFSHDNPMATPDDDLFLQHKVSLEKALTIIAGIEPSIMAEVQGMVSKIVIATGNHSSPHVRPFAGVSSAMVFGALFMNAEHYRTTFSQVEFIVHEITHTMLFAVSAEKPLVLNPLSENYPSPLRKDARPMDGIYHATLVCGRIAWFMGQWLSSNKYQNEFDRVQIKNLSQQSHENFLKGVAVINEYGMLSELGEALLLQAESMLKDKR